MAYGVAVTYSTMQLFVKGEGLADMDTFSKSDPYCVIYHIINGQRGGEVGRTEIIDNDLNPNFQKSIQVPFYFEQKQEFVAVLYDDDGKGPAGDDPLGKAEFLLSHVVGSRRATATFKLNPRGTMSITAIEVGVNGKDTVELSLGARNMKKMDWFGLSDPYFKLSRILPNGTKVQLYQSEYISNTLDPDWKPCPKFKMEQLCGADLNRPTLEIECWDSDTFSDDYMGCLVVSVQQLIDAEKDKSIFFVLRKKDKPTKQYGNVIVRVCRMTHKPTFPDYLKGGYQINLAASIDFTGSNGDPRDPRSLHFMNASSPNQYTRAIMSVGEILMPYDNDKMVPAFGFGAKLPTGQVSHFFHLNMDQNPYVHDVQGILDAYGRCLSSIQLAGPTNFAPTIRSVTEGARKSEGVYTILLIITDGEITDMDATMEAVIAADDAPISIVIVGVGFDCDFEMMDQLDGDDIQLRSLSGKMCRRDLVQFVPFKNFINAPPGALAAEVLREIPDQFCRWAEIVGIAPPKI